MINVKTEKDTNNKGDYVSSTEVKVLGIRIWKHTSKGKRKPKNDDNEHQTKDK